MLSYIARRFFYMIILLLAVSVLSFVIINLPPGDYVDRYVHEYQLQTGRYLEVEEVMALRRQFGLDQSYINQYFRWFGDIFKGDFGFSFEWNKPVNELIWEPPEFTMDRDRFIQRREQVLSEVVRDFENS